MKNLLVILMLLSNVSIYATDYYVSTVSGDESNDGLTSSTPRYSASFINSAISSASPGDVIYLERGSVWTDTTIDISSKSYITITSYGTGELPLLDIYSDESGSWSESSDVWTKNIGTSSPNWSYYKYVEKAGGPAGYYNIWNYLNYVLVDDEPYRMSLTPNSGVYDIESMNADWISDFTDTDLSLSTNEWAGGQMRTPPMIYGSILAQWVLESAGIDGNTSNRVELSGSEFASFNGHTMQEKPHGKAKYVVANLEPDLASEFAYDHSTGIARIYHTGALNSSTVKFPTQQFGIEVTNSDHIVISNIAIQGATVHHIRVDESDYVTVKNGEFQYAPFSSLWFYECDSVTVMNNSILDGCNDGIYCSNSGNIRIERNTIERIGVHLSMGYDRSEDMGCGITIGNFNDDVNIIENYIDSTGLNNIALGNETSSGNLIVNYNTLLEACLLLTDGANLYIYGYNDPLYTIEFKHNIIKSTTGFNDIQFYAPLNQLISMGIYLDWDARVDIDSNTVYLTTRGIYLHGSISTNVRGNTVYDAGIIPGSGAPAGWNGSTGFGHSATSTDDLNLKNNILLKTDNDRMLGSWFFNTFNANGSVADSNYYFDPGLDSATDDFFYTRDNKYELYPNTHAEWMDSTGFDTHSSINGNGIDNSSSLLEADELYKLLSNISYDSTRTVNLYDIPFVDYLGNVVEDSVVIQPHSSILLFRDSEGGTTSNMDLIEEIGWGTTSIGGSVPTEPTQDTIWYVLADTLWKSTADTSEACADSAVIFESAFEAGGSSIDTIAKVNYNYSSGGDQTGWTSLSSNVDPDSVEIATDVYLLNYGHLNGGANGEPNTIWPLNVSLYYHYLLNTDTDPAYYTIRGAGLDASAYYTLLLIASRDDAGVSPPRPVYLYCQSKGDTVESVGNTSNYAIVDSVQVTGDSIHFSVDRANGQYGYINGLILVEKSYTTPNYDQSQAYAVFNDVDFGSNGCDSLYIEIEHALSASEVSTYITLDSLTGDTIATITVPASGCQLQKVALSELITGTHDLYSTIDSLDTYVYILLESTVDAIVLPDYAIHIGSPFRLNPGEAVRFKPY